MTAVSAFALGLLLRVLVAGWRRTPSRRRSRLLGLAVGASALCSAAALVLALALGSVWGLYAGFTGAIAAVFSPVLTIPSAFVGSLIMAGLRPPTSPTGARPAEVVEAAEPDQSEVDAVVDDQPTMELEAPFTRGSSMSIRGTPREVDDSSPSLVLSSDPKESAPPCNLWELKH